MLTATAISPEVAAEVVRYAWWEAVMAFRIGGVTGNLILAASFGVLGGLFTRKLGTPREVVGSSIANTMLTCFVVTLGPDITGWRFASTEQQELVTAFLGFTCQHWGPVLTNSTGDWARAASAGISAKIRQLWHAVWTPPPDPPTPPDPPNE